MSFIESAVKTGYILLGLRRGPDNAAAFEAQNVHKILVVRNDNLGDVLLTVPTLRALRQAFPKAYLAVLVNAYTRLALDGIPWIDKIYSYDKFKHGKHPTRLHAWWQQYQLIKEIQKENFDLAIGVRSGFSSSHGHLVYASAACWRLGHAPGDKKKELAFFYNITVPETTKAKHEVERSLDVVRTIGVDTADKQLEFFIPAHCTQQIQDWLAQQQIRPPLAGIFFSQRTEEGRYWKVDNYIQLINTLQQDNKLTPVLIYAAADKSIAQDILQTLKTPIPSFSTPDLKLLAALLSYCKPVVVMDGGAMHIATAVGAPTIAIFSKTNPLVWAPWGEGHAVLKKGNHANTITVQDVLTAFRRIGIDQTGESSI